MGKRFMGNSSIVDAVWDGAGREIAFYRGEHLSGKTSPKFVVAVAAEPRAQVFVECALSQVFPKQALNRFGNERSGASITDRARDSRVLADCTAETKVVSVS
jgi:hypothetical protein